MSAAPVRAATGQDAQAIRALLEANALPTSDLADARPDFIVACEGSRLIGCAAIQRFDKIALVRSVAVSRDRRGMGVGYSLVRALEQHARAAELTELVLLTETAKDFFERLGYQLIERAHVPAVLLATEEFRSLCPQSAACLSKKLQGPLHGRPRLQRAGPA